MENRKTALVTGGAGSIGAAVAARLVEDGMTVVLNDIDEENVKGITNRFGGDMIPLAFDISDPEAVLRMVSKIRNDVGPVDVLVNNAGILSSNKIETTPADEWRRVLEVNVSGAFFLSKAVVPDMKQKRWGRIVNICSLAAKSGGITAGTAYTASKGALVSLTFSIARETASYGITANGISPGYVKTPMITEQLSQKKQKEMLSQIPVGRFCDPEEVAHVVAFLVHPLSGFITGEIIDINGGLLFD
ncbi:MAG: SDR family oxidoreductase [Spirochaetes bacterium]|nr:SDR family oxidoreductase [Spirochaetota bacterium]